MSRSVEFHGLSIVAPTTRCAHTCRYCSIGKTKFSTIPFSRFAAVVDRFVDWRAARSESDFKLWCWTGNCFDYDPETMAGLHRLWARTGQLSDGIATGGLRWRPEAELRDWLSAWRDLGVTRLHAAYAGHGSVHDHYNGRSGDFEFLIAIQRIGAELGMSLSQSLFLSKKTLPLIPELIEKLDSIPGNIAWRWAFPFAYLGLAVHLEDQRIDEEDRDNLPQYIAEIRGSTGEDWLSEREWIDVVRQQGELSEKAILHLNLNDSNIERIERTACDQIVEDLEVQTRAEYASIPPIHDLALQMADPSNKRIYEGREEIQRVWLDRYRKEIPATLDRNLTNIAINR